jgi:DNA-binding transcriptional ArsR family regulator
MAHPKMNGYHDDEIVLAGFAKALGHPARIAIMKHLASMPDCCFTDIFNGLPIAQSTVSQHLSELKKAGLVQGSIDVPRIYYCINPEVWRTAREMFESLFSNQISVIENNQDTSCCKTKNS